MDVGVGFAASITILNASSEKSCDKILLVKATADSSSDTVIPTSITIYPNM